MDFPVGARVGWRMKPRPSEEVVGIYSKSQKPLNREM